MKDNIDYIVFSVKQAIEAESFGFTRNECCRNLKTALHQYRPYLSVRDAFKVFKFVF